MDKIEKLMELLEELGWSCAIPSVGESNEVPGMIIGKGEYIDKIVDCLPEDLDFSDID